MDDRFVNSNADGTVTLVQGARTQIVPYPPGSSELDAAIASFFTTQTEGQ